MKNQPTLKNYEVILYLTNVKAGQPSTKVITQQAKNRNEAEVEACKSQMGQTPSVEWFNVTSREIK